MGTRAKTELLAVYLDRRPALVRHFTARTRSADRAEDIVQDIYVRIDALSEAAAAEVLNPLAFLYKVGGNLLLDAARQGRRSATREQAWSDTWVDSADGLSVSDTPSPEDAAWARLKLDQVTATLETLSPNVRTALRLHRVDGLTHAQIAAQLGVSRSSVEKYLSTALGALLSRVGWP